MAGAKVVLLHRNFCYVISRSGWLMKAVFSKEIQTCSRMSGWRSLLLVRLSLASRILQCSMSKRRETLLHRNIFNFFHI